MRRLRISLSLDTEAYKNLELLAEWLGVSKSAIVNTMLKSPVNAYLLVLSSYVFRILSKKKEFEETLKNIKEV